MNSMDNDQRELDIEKLTRILSRFQDLYYKKKEYLEDLKLEISEMKEIINNLNIMISNKSFHSADELYLDKQHELGIKPENYFKEELPKEVVKGTKIKRKIFSNDDAKDGDLLCILDFSDLNQLEIKFIDPEIRAIRETSETFINIFLKGALIKIKEEKLDLGLEYEYYKETDIIEIIKISELRSINDLDLITNKIRELLASDSFQY
jgi:hypothetical protein